jgi:hypothetical protein
MFHTVKPRCEVRTTPCKLSHMQNPSPQQMRTLQQQQSAVLAQQQQQMAYAWSINSNVPAEHRQTMQNLRDAHAHGSTTYLPHPIAAEEMVAKQRQREHLALNSIHGHEQLPPDATADVSRQAPEQAAHIQAPVPSQGRHGTGVPLASSQTVPPASLHATLPKLTDI